MCTENSFAVRIFKRKILNNQENDFPPIAFYQRALMDFRFFLMFLSNTFLSMTLLDGFLIGGSLEISSIPSRIYLL